jgi:hypothetical protein
MSTSHKRSKRSQRSRSPYRNERREHYEDYEDYHTPSKNSRSRPRGYVGRENSPHKRHHDDHLCNICECVAPNAKHQCPPKKHRYPKNLKTTMRKDYDKVKGWINPNGSPNAFKPKDSYKKSKPLRDNYNTIY